jgi:hypothetical protein
LKELSSSLQNSLVSDSAVLKLLHALRQKDKLCELNGCSAGLWLLLKFTWISHKLDKTQITGIILCSFPEVPILYLILLCADKRSVNSTL